MKMERMTRRRVRTLLFFWSNPNLLNLIPEKLCFGVMTDEVLYIANIDYRKGESMLLIKQGIHCIGCTAVSGDVHPVFSHRENEIRRWQCRSRKISLL